MWHNFHFQHFCHSEQSKCNNHLIYINKFYRLVSLRTINFTLLFKERIRILLLLLTITFSLRKKRPRDRTQSCFTFSLGRINICLSIFLTATEQLKCEKLKKLWKKKKRIEICFFEEIRNKMFLNITKSIGMVKHKS